MSKNHFLAGVGRVLYFKNDALIGVGRTLTETTYDSTITAEEIRGGQSNALWGKFFHDSNFAVTLTDSMFNMEYMAASLGVNVEMGGLSLMEEEITVSTPGSVTVKETPVAFDGAMIGWYRKPNTSEWLVGTFNAKALSISGALSGERYCVKYMYQNPDATSLTIKTRYVPAELHVVIINDLFAGEIGSQSDATKYGRLIVDIPRLQLDGNQNLALTSSGAANMSLTGSALAVSATDSCEEDTYYGTMTQEIFNEKWQDKVVALAVENGDVNIEQTGTETLTVWGVFGEGIASKRLNNADLTFAVESTPASTATGLTVGANTGLITAGSTAGTAIISVNLTGYTASVEPEYVKVTVT